MTLNNFYLGSKEEILANLANFGYDPINYGHFRKLNVLDLFMGKDRNIIFFTGNSFSSELNNSTLDDLHLMLAREKKTFNVPDSKAKVWNQMDIEL